MNTIPSIHLHVSIDTFYNLLKVFCPGFGWSFQIDPNELTKPQDELLDFLAQQHAKRQMGRMVIIFHCTKIGKPETKEVHIEDIIKNKSGYLIKDSY
jgi:hypothetical protein